MYLFCFGFCDTVVLRFWRFVFYLVVLRLGYGFGVVWVCGGGFGGFSSLDRALRFVCGSVLLF